MMLLGAVERWPGKNMLEAKPLEISRRFFLTKLELRFVVLFAALAAFSSCGSRIVHLSEGTVAPLALSATALYVGTSRLKSITPTGGTPPYKFQMLSGNGSFEAANSITGTYTAPATITGNSVQEVLSIKDARGNEINVTLTIAVPGTVDTSFGAAGTALLDYLGGDDIGRRVLIQSDGKIVSTGYAFNGTQNVFAISRFNSDGTLDSSFGTSGQTTVAIGSTNDYAFEAVQQTDGKLVIGGYTVTATNGNDFAAIRLNLDGTLDTTFGTAGKKVITLGSGNDEAYTIRLQSDGKIVLGGAHNNGANTDFAVVRLTTAGSLDATFGTDGIFTTAVGASNDIGKALLVQSDDKLILIGQAVMASTDAAVVRFTKNGALDTSFAAGGIFTYPFHASTDVAESGVIQSDGTIVISGRSGPSPSDFLIFRLSSNGNLDTSFGSAGSSLVQTGTGDDLSYGVLALSSGGFVAVGYSHNGTDYDFSACRLTAGGVLDTSFNTTGKILIPIGSSHNQAYGIAEDSLGRILIHGWSTIGASKDLTIVRYWP